jgi:menaquinone-dependent protoporphyrinogen oxidase
MLQQIKGDYVNMTKIILIYSTTDGHTKKICNRLKEVIENHNNQAELVSIIDNDKIYLAAYDKIVLGASIRYGRHNRLVYNFIKKNSKVLESKPNAFFSVNLVAQNPEKNKPTTNPYVKKFLRQISWEPQNIELFAGKLDYQKYGIVDRFLMRLIVWMTKGPTNPKTNIEYTNWTKVEEFGNIICKMQ